MTNQDSPLSFEEKMEPGMLTYSLLQKSAKFAEATSVFMLCLRQKITLR